MKTILATAEFQEEIQKIEGSNQKQLAKYHQAISYCRNILEGYRKEVRSGFLTDIPTEIKFFKEQKQIPAAQLIYYHYLSTYEMEVTNLNQYLQRKYINEKIKKLNRLFQTHNDFVKYLELERNYLDEIYFTRKYFAESGADKCYDRDPAFSTSHDLLLSELKASKKYLVFLQTSLNDLNGIHSKQEEELPKIQWTSSKVALTELVYALHHSGSINNGNASLKDLVKNIEKLLGVELGDYHHTFLRLRERSQPVKFLDRMRSKLTERIEEMDS